MKKLFLLLSAFLFTNIYGQQTSQEINPSSNNSTYNKINQTNKICISMAEELDKMKANLNNQSPMTVDYFRNKEIYIKTSAEWIKVCGTVK